MARGQRESEQRRPRWWAGLVMYVAAVLLGALLVLPQSLLIYESGATPDQIRDSWWQVGYKLACGFGTIALVFVALRMGRRPVRANLYLAPAAWGSVLLVVALLLAAAPWSRFIAEIADPSLNSIPMREMPPWTAPVLGVFAIRVLLVPLTEELLFRGYILSAFRSRSSALAIVVSALLFAAFHFDLQSLRCLMHLPFGVITAYSVIRLGSLLPAIVAHAAWNLLAGFSIAPTRWFEPGPLVLAFASLILIGGVILLNRWTDPQRPDPG